MHCQDLIAIRYAGEFPIEGDYNMVFRHSVYIGYDVEVSKFCGHNSLLVEDFADLEYDLDGWC